MARYTDQEKQTLQSISIVEIMAHLDKNLYNQKGMYYSPFRDEATPSFHIDVATNRWYDFGTSEGGGLFDFVCRIAGITRGEVYDWLASFRSIIPESEYREVVEKAKKVKAVVHSGQRKDGEAFTCCIQFDAAKREPTVSHPSWYKEAQRAGMEAAPKQKQEEKAAQQQKASQEQGQSQKRSGGLKK